MMMKQANDINAPVNLNEVDKLARLLATENISVEHSPSAKTAYFELKTRRLCLPCWKDLTKPLYHMLIGHEVGHALYTETEKWRAEVTAEPRMAVFLNVVEDARIEKLMKEKFPGLRRDFHYGYETLEARDFFKLKSLDRPLEACSLIDRLNLHFKIGNFVKIPFEASEQAFIPRIEAARSFEDVVVIAKELFDRAIEKGDPSQGQDSPEGSKKVKVTIKGKGFPGQSGPKDKSDEPQSSEQGESEAGDGEDGEDESQGGGASASQDDGDEEFDLEIEIEVDELSADSYDALNDALQQMVNNNTQETSFAYVDLPKNTDYSKHLVEYKNVLGYVRKTYPDALTNGFYPALYKQNIKTINYLIKEFEMRKAAKLYERATQAKTGVINVNKLHQYQLVDDIFKRTTVLPKGKNHGIVMFVDFSGSMSGIMNQTIIELFNLTVFCRKVNIPFRVFAFTDSKSAGYRFNRNVRHDHNAYRGVGTRVVPAENAILLELFNNKMNSKDFTDAMESLLCNFATVGRRAHIDIYGLSSTPLNCAAIMAHNILEDFREATKADIISAVFLTDGDSNHMHVVGGDGSGWGQKLVLKNKTTGRSYTSIEQNYSSTDVLFRSLSGQGFNVIGYRVGSKNDIRTCLQYHAKQLNAESYAKANAEIAEDSCTMIEGFRGCDQYYLLALENKYSRSHRDRGEDEFSFEVKTKGDKAPSKSQITRAFIAARTGRMSNRKILSNFAKKIAGETR